jgi:hypothetical protein
LEEEEEWRGGGGGNNISSPRLASMCVLVEAHVAGAMSVVEEEEAEDLEESECLL